MPIFNITQAADAQKFAALFPEIAVHGVPCHPPFLASWPARVVRKVKQIASSFAPTSGTANPHRTPPTPRYPFGGLPRPFIEAIEEELKKGVDIFQAEFAEMLTLGPLFGRRVPSVFIHHQPHFMYARRFHDSEHGDTYSRYVSERMSAEERGYLQAFDTIVAFSQVDRGLLESFCPALRVEVSPFPSPEEPAAEAPRIETVAPAFVFVGGESHEPNLDGLRWFMAEVWNHLRRQLPNATVEVLGRWSLGGRRLIPHHRDIHFRGYVEDLELALRHKITVVPIRIGSGIRTKILAAWGSSSPVVTTTVGVEGLPGLAGRDFLRADEAEAFADCCVQVVSDARRCNELCENGRAIVQAHFSLEAVRATRLAIYQRMLGIEPDEPSVGPAPEIPLSATP